MQEQEDLMKTWLEWLQVSRWPPSQVFDLMGSAVFSD